jgi:hypothetical protein
MPEVASIALLLAAAAPHLKLRPFSLKAFEVGAPRQGVRALLHRHVACAHRAALATGGFGVAARQQAHGCAAVSPAHP